MSMHFVRALSCAACLLLSTVAVAADLIPVQDFARRAVLSNPTLSPDGQFIALDMRDPDNGSDALVVFRVADMSHPLSMLRLPKYEVATDITWVSNTRLVVEKGQQFGSVDEPLSTGEILATDFDGKHQDYLYGYQGGSYGARAGTRNNDQGFGSVVGVPTPRNGHFYMATQSFDVNRRSSTLYDVDAGSGVRHLIGEIGVGGMDFMVGADGKPHYAYGRDRDWNYVVYHRQAGGWAPMTAEQVGVDFQPLHFTPDSTGSTRSLPPTAAPPPWCGRTRTVATAACWRVTTSAASA